MSCQRPMRPRLLPLGHGFLKYPPLSRLLLAMLICLLSFLCPSIPHFLRVLCDIFCVPSSRLFFYFLAHMSIIIDVEHRGQGSAQRRLRVDLRPPWLACVYRYTTRDVGKLVHLNKIENQSGKYAPPTSGGFGTKTAS